MTRRLATLATLATLVILTLLAVAVLLTAASAYVYRTNDDGTIGRAKLDGSGIDQAPPYAEGTRLDTNPEREEVITDA